ncbi:RNA-directed DNA polymerase, eukaryota, partial [Tanacetum coccineum]
SKVEGNMSWIKSWDEIVDKMVDRLSKWKMKTLSIGLLKLFMAKMGKMVADSRYPRLYALEVKKTVDVASKLSQENLTWSFRRAPRSGVEQDQLTDLTTYVEGVVLGVTPDRWYWTLDGSGEFSVASARKVIDDNRFPEVSTQTRWIKAVPIKVNIHAWKVRMDCLPTRLNISRRGIDIPSILCPVCGSVTESSSHLFFDCLVAKDNFRKICRWWEVDFMEVHTFDEWVSWIVNLRIPIKHKRLLEGFDSEKVKLDTSFETEVIIPFAFDTFGFLAPEAVELLSRVQRVMHSNVMTPRSTDVVFKRIGFAIQKGLAAQLVARLPFTIM